MRRDLLEFLLRFVPVAGCTGCIIRERLAPGFLEWPGGRIQSQRLYQCLRANAGLQEAGATWSSGSETDDAYNVALGIKSRPAAIAMFHVAANLNHGRSRIRRFHGANEDFVN